MLVRRVDKEWHVPFLQKKITFGKVATDTNILYLRTRYRYMKGVSSVSFRYLDTDKVCLISPGTDLPGEWALLALGSFPGLLRQTLDTEPN